MGLRKKIADAAERVVLGKQEPSTQSVADALKKAAEERKQGEK